MPSLPDEELADFKLAELRLLAQASKGQKTGQQTTVHASGQAFLAAEYLASQSFLALTKIEAFDQYTYRITDKGEKALADCLNYITLA